MRYLGANSVLVPLTNSLYVRGELADADTVLVDIGTGFLVEKVRHSIMYHAIHQLTPI
jgi:prefoldin subunit 5